jgi:sugar O-acyltransferase (sialic acid O-acetyltransferase NeuD family)
MTTSLLILGAGNFAREVADLASDTGEHEVAGFVVSTPPYRPGQTLLGKPVHWIDDLAGVDRDHQCVCAIGSSKRWQLIESVTGLGFRFTSVIHPTARVSRTAVVGPGCLISAGVMVSTDTAIGAHVLVNRGVLMGHHVTVHDYATISPGANLGGLSTIGRCAWVGMGAIVLDKRSVGEQSIVGSGALVTRDIPNRVKALGVPARVVEENVDGY